MRHATGSNLSDDYPSPLNRPTPAGSAPREALSAQDRIDAEAWLAFMEILAPDDIISGKAGLLRRLLDAALRAELGRAGTGLDERMLLEAAGMRAGTWEEAARFVEKQADVYGEKAVPVSARPVAVETLRQVAKALRARAAAPDAERLNG